MRVESALATVHTSSATVFTQNSHNSHNSLNLHNYRYIKYDYSRYGPAALIYSHTSKVLLPHPRSRGAAKSIKRLPAISEKHTHCVYTDIFLYILVYRHHCTILISEENKTKHTTATTTKNNKHNKLKLKLKRSTPHGTVPYSARRIIEYKYIEGKTKTRAHTTGILIRSGVVRASVEIVAMGQTQTALALEMSESPSLRTRPAILDGPSGTLRGFTFQQLERFVGLLAKGLQEQCQVGQGSVVAMFAPNLPEWALVFHATAGLGAVMTPCSLSLTDEELAFQIADSGASVLITVPSLVDRARKAIANTFEKRRTSKELGGKELKAADDEKASVFLYVIGAAAEAKSFGTLLQHGSADWNNLGQGDNAQPGKESVLMPAELPAIYSYSPVGHGYLKRDTVTHEDLLKAFYPDGDDENGSGGDKGEEDGEQEHASDAKSVGLNLNFGDDVLLGMLPFWRLDCFLGVLLSANFQFCTVVTVDCIDPISIRKIVADTSVTVLPATGKMMRMMANAGVTASSGASQGSLRELVCVSDKVSDDEETDRDSMSALSSSWKSLCMQQVKATCMTSITELGKVVDTDPIEYPNEATSGYMMPASFRMQDSKLHSGSNLSPWEAQAWRSAARGDNTNPSLIVTTDITIVSGGPASAHALSASDVVDTMLLSGGSKVSAQVRPNGITVEANGPWNDVFEGLAYCHELAHSKESGSSIHTTMSLSSTASGMTSGSNSGHLGVPRTPMATSGGDGEANDMSVHGRKRSSSIGTPLSPEMQEMHASLQLEEEKIREEIQRRAMLKKKLDQTRAAAAKIKSQNFDLEEKVRRIGDASESEKKRMTLKRFQGSGHSPRNSWSGSEFDSRSHRGSKSSRDSFSKASSDNQGAIGQETAGRARLDSASNSGVSNPSQVDGDAPISVNVSTQPSGSAFAASDSDATSLEAASGANMYQSAFETVHEADEDDLFDDGEGEDSMAMDLKEELEEDMRNLLNKGVQLFGENKAEEAEPLFEEVVRIARDLGNQSVEGRAVGNLASVFESTGRHHEAINLYMQCIDILKEVGDSRKEARILYNVSHSYLSLNKYDEAIDYLNQSLALTNDDATRLAVEQQLAVVRHAMIQQGAEDDDRLMDF